MDQESASLALCNAKLNTKLGNILLSNARENYQIQQLNVKYFGNQFQILKEKELLEDKKLENGKKIKDFIEKIEIENIKSIHSLQKESIKRRNQILNEINLARHRIEQYKESIESSKQITSKSIPYFDSKLILDQETYKKKIKVVQQAVENLRSKKPTWEKIQTEYEELLKNSSSIKPESVKNEQKYPPMISFRDIEKSLK